MRVLVCISYVPDTATRPQVASDGKQIERAGVKFILNPYDEYAIEEGLRVRERFGGEVLAVCVGPEGAKEILRTALAMGVDRALLVRNGWTLDSFGVATALATVARQYQPELILMGRQSIDWDSFQMPSTVGELLGYPSVAVVSRLEIADDGAVIAERDVEGGKEVVRTRLPCVISVQKGINEPRYPRLPDIIKAKSKPIDEIAPPEVEPLSEVVQLTLPQRQRAGKILGPSDAELDELIRLLHEEAKVI
ncbi:MAG: electron transfer flavoprotein subunit beta/FixA family protein [Candidatus Kapabacteria bacterium]|nr:electron transfer flavoprotein subunit beta/FixA family protein [Candidatus Kapabacteria bacterium]MDW8011759.1 electron transfer flavoprotein subunit beta/FixA family protein [Bacteroidota bacterium]